LSLEVWRTVKAVVEPGVAGVPHHAQQALRERNLPACVTAFGGDVIRPVGVLAQVVKLFGRSLAEGEIEVAALLTVLENPGLSGAGLHVLVGE
jgi:hypothetical protein